MSFAGLLLLCSVLSTASAFCIAAVLIEESSDD